jgi:hypothetical protein
MAEHDESYRDILGRILRSRDPEALREFLLEGEEKFGDPDEDSEVEFLTERELAELMHRMILARPDLKELHAASSQALGIKPTQLPGSPRSDHAGPRPTRPRRPKPSG